MGTQWVLRSKEAGRDELGARPAYRPRHAKPRRHQPPGDYPGNQASVLGHGPGPAGQTESPGRGNEAFDPAPISQLRDQAATIARDHSLGYGDERWFHPGSV